MWDELPPLVAIKANKEESKLTFNAYNVSLFDDDLDSDNNNNANNNDHTFHNITQEEICAQKNAHEHHRVANLECGFPPTTLQSSKESGELVQESGNCYNYSQVYNNYNNVEQITQNKTQEFISTVNAKKYQNSNDNNNISNTTLTTLMSKCNLGKAKELLHFANAPWHNELESFSEVELQGQQMVKNNQNKKYLQNANSSSTSSSRIEDAVDMLHAYMSRIKSYTLYKNKCTDAYLTDIERAVDRYLLNYFSDNHDTSASMPLVSPVKFMEHLQTNWWPGKHNNSRIRTPTNNVCHNNGNEESTLRLEEFSNNNNNNNLLQNVEWESEWSSTAREVAKAGLNKAGATLKNMSSAWFKTQANDNDNLYNIKTEIKNNNTSNSNHSDYNKLNMKGKEYQMDVAIHTNDNMKGQKETKFYYTCDVIPEHYTDEAPSTEALQRIRMNYPILLYVLNHTLQHESKLSGNPDHYCQHEQQQQSTSVSGVQTQSDWANNANRMTTFKPIQRKWMQSDIAKALYTRGKTYDEYTRLRSNLFLPTIKKVWEMYLQPLHDKAIELLHIAEENISQVMHEWKMKLVKETELSTLCVDEQNKPQKVAPLLYKTNKCTSFAKLTKQMTVLMTQVDSAIRNLHSDVEYIDKIRRMDDAFITWQNVNSGINNYSSSGIKSNIINITNGSNKNESIGDVDLHHTWGSIHTMSDQIPVYGLILSRLHRLEMEHRTVLELWDHAEMYIRTCPSYI